MAVFHVNDCIRKTKQGIPLTAAEIGALVRGITKEPLIPDYQLSAWLMAVCLRGLTDDETAALTMAMRDSGQTMHWDMLGGPVADKHSTGGVGDKTTLILAPIAAACGIFMPKMSGRGLGHTGGTIDKLESIPGFSTALAPEAFLEQVKKIGFAVAMQTGDLAPADKKLYALRDVTETVDSIPLICASIMSKKLATGADHILLDVKVGSGAFMKNDEDAAELARLMLAAAKADGRDCTAVLTDMDRPLGMNIGNALEVLEALEVLDGDTESALGAFCVTLAAELLHMAGKGTKEACRAQALQAVQSGAAMERFAQMIAAQGGDPRVTENRSLLPVSPCTRTVKAERGGWIAAMQSEQIGRASVLLGAGRMTKADSIDPGAGIRLTAQYGDKVAQGDPLMTLYAQKESQLDEAEAFLRGAVSIAETEPEQRPLIRKIYSTGDAI
ncbi:MAG: thymidine phosphorylase [Oscillospiraceae bacterium]|nr:thymidine phosphorylase [Oscillospiraceae bacterium]